MSFLQYTSKNMRKLKNFETFLEFICFGLGIITNFWIALKASESLYYSTKPGDYFYLLIGVLLFIGVTIIIGRKLNENKIKAFLIFLLIIAFIIRLIYIIKIPTLPVSDFETKLNLSRQILDGSINWSNEFLVNWSNEIPFLLYEVCILKFVDSVFALKFMNIIFTLGNILLVFLISQNIISKKSALIVTIFYSFFPQTIYMTSVLTNQIISLFFTLLGIYLIIYSRNLKYLILGGISLSVANCALKE